MKSKGGFVTHEHMVFRTQGIQPGSRKRSANFIKHIIDGGEASHKDNMLYMSHLDIAVEGINILCKYSRK